MKNNTIRLLYIFLACAMLAIGRMQDNRLVFFDIDFSIVFSFTYLILSIFMLSTIKKIFFDTSKFLLILFYIIIIFVTPFLWSMYGITEAVDGKFGGSLLNYSNFLIIVIPISIIVMEKFEYKDLKLFIKILFLVSVFLAAISIFFVSELKNGRLVALGGGPIVFCRWMMLAILVLIFYPNQQWKILKALSIIGFLILALATGSRGPFIALLLTGLIYSFLNFRRVILFLVPICAIFIYTISFTSIQNQVNEIGNAKRVFMNFSDRGFKNKSLETRFDLIERSFLMMREHPFGVGAGNWQIEANRANPAHLMNGNLYYPHNLFLEVSNEYGVYAPVILLILFIYITYSGFIKLRKLKNKSISLYPLFFYLMIFLILNSFFSGSLIDNRLLFIIISILLIKRPSEFYKHTYELKK